MLVSGFAENCKVTEACEILGIDAEATESDGAEAEATRSRAGEIPTDSPCERTFWSLPIVVEGKGE